MTLSEHYQLPTKNNVLFEEPLSEILQFRITQKEKSQLDTVAKNNFITTSELIRNLIRENLYKYAMSINLQNWLQISNEIDRLLIEHRLISSRKETCLSKIREILTDFEVSLDIYAKNFNEVEAKNKVSQIEYLLKIVYEHDNGLSEKIDSQVRRIYKNKRFKSLKQQIIS